MTTRRFVVLYMYTCILYTTSWGFEINLFLGGRPKPGVPKNSWFVDLHTAWSCWFSSEFSGWVSRMVKYHALFLDQIMIPISWFEHIYFSWVFLKTRRSLLRFYRLKTGKDGWKLHLEMSPRQGGRAVHRLWPCFFGNISYNIYI